MNFFKIPTLVVLFTILVACGVKGPPLPPETSSSGSDSEVTDVSTGNSRK